MEFEISREDGPEIGRQPSTSEASTIPTEGHAMASDPNMIPTEVTRWHQIHTRSHLKDANFY
jgi:hypothetical protein